MRCISLNAAPGVKPLLFSSVLAATVIAVGALGVHHLVKGKVVGGCTLALGTVSAGVYAAVMKDRHGNQDEGYSSLLMITSIVLGGLITSRHIPLMYGSGIAITTGSLLLARSIFTMGKLSTLKRDS